MARLGFILLLFTILLTPVFGVTINERLQKIEINQAEIKTELKAINQRFNDFGNAINHRFDALNQRISDLYIVVVASMIGIFSFSAYLAYDRRKLNNIIIEIEQGIYENKRKHKDQDKNIEGLTEALKKLAKKDKSLADTLHKFGLM